MATHSSVLAHEIPMGGGAGQAIAHGVAKTERLSTSQDRHGGTSSVPRLSSLWARPPKSTRKS